MSNEIVQAQYEALDGAAQRFAQQAEAQRQLARVVAQTAAPLQHGGWIGRGSLAFFGEMEREVSPALARLIAALQEGAEVTRQMVQAMRDAEEAAARLFAVGMGVVAVPPGALDGGDFGGLDPSMGGGAAGSARTPPPRVYIVNGINSLGNQFGVDRNGNPIFADDDSITLEKMLEGAGLDPDQVVSTSAIYLKPEGTQLTGTALTGTQLGGWMSPVDWLTGAGATFMNTTTQRGADMVNSATKFVTTIPGYGAVHGSLQVMGERALGRYGPESNSVYTSIQKDLQRHSLLPGQSIMLIGHSGGGQVITNVAGMIERDMGHNVSHLATIGSPVANYNEASRYAENIREYSHMRDFVHHAGYLVQGVEQQFGIDSQSVQSGSSKSTVFYNTPDNGIIDAHMTLLDDPAVGKDVARWIQRPQQVNPL